MNATSTIVCESASGRPVILVRAMEEEAVWYVQAPAERVEGKKFHCPVNIGNAGTPAGSPFQVALVVAHNAADERLFVPGAVLSELPAGREVMGLVDVVRE